LLGLAGVLAVCLTFFVDLPVSEVFFPFGAEVFAIGFEGFTAGFDSEAFFLFATVESCLVGWDLAAFTVGFTAALTGADLALAVSSAGLAGFTDAMGSSSGQYINPCQVPEKGPERVLWGNYATKVACSLTKRDKWCELFLVTIEIAPQSGQILLQLVR